MITGVDYEALLASLDSEKFRALWPSQEFVLSQYGSDYSAARDLAIELPTGGGKTLISLLIAESWRQRGQPAALLSANKTLARQMKRESDALGIPAVLMEG
jgi:superfamily II DNA or RNA helicase